MAWGLEEVYCLTLGSSLTPQSPVPWAPTERTIRDQHKEEDGSTEG